MNCRVALIFFAAILSLLSPHSALSQDLSNLPKGPIPEDTYFKTSFQYETEYIIETVTLDLAEMIYYAANGNLPDKGITVRATEMNPWEYGDRQFVMKVTAGSAPAPVESDLVISQNIWMPDIYAATASELASHHQLNKGKASDAGESLDLFVPLSNLTVTEIEKQNKLLSDKLASDFMNPVYHEQAAALIGCLSLREHSGRFYEIRVPLCRMSAHLAFARELNSGKTASPAGEFAEVLVHTLTGSQKEALTEMQTIAAKYPEMAVWQRALRMRNTNDYRPFFDIAEPTVLDKIEGFRALVISTDTTIAWVRMKNHSVEPVTDWLRISNGAVHSVSLGHYLAEVSIPAELAEIQETYKAFHGVALPEGELATALNHEPDRALAVSPEGKVTVQVIGWGQYARYLQQQLCESLASKGFFLAYKYGVPAAAEAFANDAITQYSMLNLFPLAYLYMAYDDFSYRRANEGSLEVVVATPHLVPQRAWNHTCYVPRFANEKYIPRDPHINEWNRHCIPSYTVYNIDSRLGFPVLMNRPDRLDYFEMMRNLAPYNKTVANMVAEIKYDNELSNEVALQLFGGMLEYMPAMMASVAKTSENPEKYLEYMKRAALHDPVYHFDLWQHYSGVGENEVAAEHLTQGIGLHHDDVKSSYYALWLVNYHLKRKKPEKAEAIANWAGDVYSALGLKAKARFLEQQNRHEEAEQVYVAIYERYGRSNDYLAYRIRQRILRPSAVKDPVDEQIEKIFPNGIRQVSAVPSTPPKTGVLFPDENELMQEWGLRKNDVIVSLNGYSVETVLQYTTIRDVIDGPWMNFLIWRDGKYIQSKACLLDGRFGVNIVDYVANR